VTVCALLLCGFHDPPPLSTFFGVFFHFSACTTFALLLFSGSLVFFHVCSCAEEVPSGTPFLPLPSLVFRGMDPPRSICEVRDFLRQFLFFPPTFCAPGVASDCRHPSDLWSEFPSKFWSRPFFFLQYLSGPSFISLGRGHSLYQRDGVSPKAPRSPLEFPLTLFSPVPFVFFRFLVSGLLSDHFSGPPINRFFSLPLDRVVDSPFFWFATPSTPRVFSYLRTLPSHLLASVVLHLIKFLGGVGFTNPPFSPPLLFFLRAFSSLTLFSRHYSFSPLMFFRFPLGVTVNRSYIL